uniref:Uncharacterized protein n=1 Tax=Spongospora subterranea TaxID=70186 RepID=A0A0H5R9K8_9EUKA|eukprot:CRZ05119.1 hypothetical protein [Spongospora subterranea]
MDSWCRCTFPESAYRGCKVVEVSMDGYRTISHWFKAVGNELPSFSHDDLVLTDQERNEEDSLAQTECIEEFVDSIDEAIAALTTKVCLKTSKVAEMRIESSKFESLQFMCVLRYLEAIKHNPRMKMKSSLEIGKMIFGTGQGCDYRSRKIRLGLYLTR